MDCSKGQLARWSGSGGAATAGACCGRQLAATADLTVALWGARGGRGGVAVQEDTWRASCCWPRARTGAGRDAAARAHVRAKRTLWARPEHARDVFDEMPVHARGRG